MNFATIGLALSALTLAACSTAPTPAVQVETRTKVIDTGCAWTKPIYLNKADVLAPETADSILAHNRAGAERCGWKPLAPAK
ncbi:hypothetical protein [Burkholderia gladioli]|uniref:hypothetical protein n=1 Tax=Burkholderia gladioli TaxID=28095 RepID=UPI0016414474|nr:hypothetical protein [Burkholderia gladioli]